MIYGANDGIITTFAVVASIEGAGLSVYAILAVGLASLFADGTSMATSSYLATKSDKEVRDHDGKNSNNQKPLLESFITFMAFTTAGSVPLAPYIFIPNNKHSYLISGLTAVSTLFVIGGLRTKVTQKNFFKAGIEMAFLGAIAGGVAFYIGNLVARLQ